MKTTRVLLVEDDLWVARLNRVMVEAVEGFAVVGHAETAGQARELAAALRPDLLLVDVYLPDGTGLELVRELREQTPSPEVVMITAANDLPSVQQALHEGVLDYLIKPFQQPRLREALERYLQRRTAQQAGATFTQTKLDRLLGFRSSQLLPKGIDAATLEQVQHVLTHSAEPLSAEELGERMGLSRVTAWRYLEHLLHTGSAVLELSYGRLGRPVKRYRATGP
ncbi:MAG: response regulator [Meiothermus sp.]|nr:response regulator [Meiothermus sp.]